MTIPSISPLKKKNRKLRNILWIIFAISSIIILVTTSLSGRAALLIEKTTSFSSLFVENGKIFWTLFATTFIKIGIVGCVCLLIYAFGFYRLHNDNELFN